MTNHSLVGKIFKSQNCGYFEVIDYQNYKNVKVRFLETGYEFTTQKHSIESGRIKDRLLPSVYGVGVIGDRYKSCDGNGKNTKEYDTWIGMLARCYSDYIIKYPSYKECFVSENFKNYSFFYEWLIKQQGIHIDSYNLDKDLLKKGNKVYSEDTCLILPTEINNALLKRERNRGDCCIGVSFAKGKYVSTVRLGRGKQKKIGVFNTENEAFQAYKQAKEQYLKQLAEKWKGEIDPRAYDALINYQVETTD